MVEFLGRKWELGTNEVQTLDFWRGVSGEFLATFLFLLTSLIGIWGPDSGNFDYGHLVAGALGTGLCISILVQMFDQVSGANINPAVSVALLVNGQISVIRGVVYVAAQMAGSIASSILVKLVTLEKTQRSWSDSNDVFNKGTPKMADGFELGGFVLEFIFTSVLVFQVIRCTDQSRPIQSGNIALSVGLVVAVANFCLIPITGGAINPARIGGPAIVGLSLSQVGFYWAGQFLAAVVTPFIYCPVLNKSPGKNGFGN